MKTINYIFLFVSLSFFAQAQTIRRVNATPGVTGVNIYATVQAAHDASVAGDIIYLEPVNTNNTDYGAVTINKRITLIGTGYDPTLITGSNFDKRTVSMSSINLNRGSAMSRITGLRIGSMTIKDANCIVERNKIENTLYLSYETFEGTTTSGKNTTIRNNSLNGILGVGNQSGVGIPSAITSNNIISNNIMFSYVAYLVSSTITRNTFFHNSNNYIFEDVDGSSISANIFDARDANTFFATVETSCQGNTISNNLCIRHAGLPANNGNVNSVSSSTVFKVTNPWTVNPFLESNLELSVNSPALTVGPSSTPIGAFSGTTPFVPSGLTNIPFITDFSINGIGNVNSPLQINVKARSNN
jgi:hypothetical protein